MKFLPGIGVSKLSGTIGGVTAQNWKGLGIFRRKPTPTNVNTPRQTVIRSIMTLLSRAWRDELNQGLRTAWNQRAKTYPWLDVFGNERKMSGENLYIKQNMVLLDHGLTRQDTPVPDIVPPELVDLSFVDESDFLAVQTTGLSPAIVTAQTPFIDVMVAGGVVDTSSTSSQLNIFSQGLPAGRKHQKSDFRHVAYVADLPLAEPPLPFEFTLNPSILERPTNLVFILRRYNKYGNFSAPLLFEGVRLAT